MFVAAISADSAEVNADDDGACESVKGRITSNVVPCDVDDAFLLCTAGEFDGDIEGNFEFVADLREAIPSPREDDLPFLLFTTGDIELTTEDGTLTLIDSSAFAPSSFGTGFPVDYFASVQTVVDGTGEFAGATGFIRAEGRFSNGCFDCKYRGEICGIGDDGGDGDDDDDDDD